MKKQLGILFDVLLNYVAEISGLVVLWSSVIDILFIHHHFPSRNAIGILVGGLLYLGIRTKEEVWK